MKPTRTNPLFARFFRGNTLVTAVVVSLVGLASPPAAQAGDLYWDTNADVAGSGNAGGTWDSGTNWTTDATGATATVGWISGDTAIFSASTDGTAAKTVTIAGTVATAGIRLEEAGLVTLTGGAIDITGGSTFDTSVFGAGGGGSLTWNPAIIGSGNLTLKVNGDLSDTGGGSDSIFTLTGANTFTGAVRITGGTVNSISNFGDAANKIILDGGALIDNAGGATTFARNIEVGAAGGVIRQWGGRNTQLNGTLSNEAGVAIANLKHTDGGNLKLNGSGAGFIGTFTNARGNLELLSQNWSGMDLVCTDGGNVTYIATAGDTTIKSLTCDRDVVISSGARLNIAGGLYHALAGTDIDNFWMQGEGKLTSSSNVLTLNWDTSYEVAGDQAIRVIVDDYAVGVPLKLIKNWPGLKRPTPIPVARKSTAAGSPQTTSRPSARERLRSTLVAKRPSSQVARLPTISVSAASVARKMPGRSVPSGSTTTRSPVTSTSPVTPGSVPGIAMATTPEP